VREKVTRPKKSLQFKGQISHKMTFKIKV